MGNSLDLCLVILDNQTHWTVSIQICEIGGESNIPGKGKITFTMSPTELIESDQYFG